MKTTWGSFFAVSLLILSSTAGAQTAVIETNHLSHYVPSNFNGFTMTEGYAPHAVFFEGWKSSPSADIVDWKWNFGDGTPEFHAFNAGHVFENPGTYTVTLTVTTKSGGTASATTTVTVHAPDGTTYYVDSSIGDDSNDGLSEQTPWKTAQHAFNGMANHRYDPGDRILFKRGLVYDIWGNYRDANNVWQGAYVSHYKAGWGYSFATYGEGRKPILKNVGGPGTGDTGNIITIVGKGAYRIKFQDLEVDLENAAGERSGAFFDAKDDSQNFLFWRMNFYNCKGSVYFSGNPEAYRVGNVFLHESSVQNSARIMLWTRASRVSMIGNNFDWAENHIHYGSWIDTAVIADNIHSRPAWGRTALRVSGKSDNFDLPSQNIHIIRNYFGGHVDPLDSSTGEAGAHLDVPDRYNYQMLYLAPNKRSVQAINNVVFEKNVITNCEQALILGSYNDSIIRDNLIMSVDNYGDAPRITLGHKYEMKPLDNIVVENNTFITNEIRSGNASAIAILPYDDDPFNGLTEHRNISILNNKFYAMGADNPMIWYDYSRHSTLKNDPTAGHVALLNMNNFITINNNSFFKSGSDMHGYAGGYWNTPSTHGVIHDLASWQATYNQSANAQYFPQDTRPYPAQVYANAFSYVASVDINFDNGLDANRNAVSQVYLWKKIGNGNWQDANLPPQSGPDGTFTYVPNQLGRHYWATVTIDSNGAQSITPNELPTPFANAWTDVYATDGEPPPPPEPDETAPTVGPAASPATTMSNPVNVTYTDAQDDSGGSGLRQVHLWVKPQGGSWSNTGLTTPGGSNQFPYSMPDYGTFSFAVQAEDNEGNFSPEPSGAGDTTTVYEQPPVGVLAHLQFDDPPDDGQADDSSGLGNHGTMVSGRTPSQEPVGQVGAAYDFSNDYVSLGALDIPGSAMTLSCWINADNYSNTFRRIVAKANGIQSALTWWGITTTNPANQVRFQMQTADGVVSNLTAPNQLQAGTWYHLAGVYDGTIMRFYVDGEEVASEVKSGLIANNSSLEAWVGDCPPAAGSRPFPGKIDDVRIYNMALSATQIAELAGEAVEPEPVDSTPPNPGAASSPALVNTANIQVDYAGANDADSGLASVALWARKDNGAWTNTGLTGASAIGSFTYPTSGDGIYRFAMQATDNEGNTSAAPTGNGQSTTQVDSTAPGIGTITVAEQSTKPIQISYAGVEDTSGGSGVAAVRLWAKLGNGEWTNTGMSKTVTAGTFNWNNVNTDGTYSFMLRTVDSAGNESPLPSGAGQASTVVDTTAPNAGTVTASVEETSTSPITLNYTGASDDVSGIDEVQLYYKRNSGGTWTNSGLTGSTGSGSFTFPMPFANGTYYFDLRAKDLAGNLSPVPAGAGDDFVKYDNKAPTIASMSTPGEYASSSPVTVSYFDVVDSLSDVQEIRLYFRKDGGAWTDSGDTRTTEDGSFSFTPSGDGDYDFDVLMTDTMGNSSDVPSGGGRASIMYDTTAPADFTLSGPESATEGPIGIDYSGVVETGSGLKEVVLWVKRPDSGWQQTQRTATTASGSLNFNSFPADGNYSFAIQAEDNAGNKSPAPAGLGDVTVSFDGTAPTKPTLTAPGESNESPITINYSGASDANGSLASVRLWARKGGGSWADTGNSQTTGSGQFSYAFTGDDTYYFDVVVEDEAGNTTADPTGDGLDSTIYDTSGPELGTATSPETASEIPITVDYTSESGVAKAYLWFKKGNGGWTDSGLVSNSETGSFAFNNVAQDGDYFFAIQTEDSLGNKSDLPSGNGSSSTTFDSLAPETPTLSATTPTGDTPIEITYTGATDATSDVEEVALWFKKGIGGAWTPATASPGAAESGSFSFSDLSGDGTYFFGTVASDTAGNETPPPAGSGDLEIVYDGTAPNPGVASSPETLSTEPITVTYAGANDAGSGLDSVELWVRQDAGAWQASGLPAQNSGSGSFTYAPPSDGTFFFGLRATDDLGNESDAPTGDGDTSTVFDSTPPSGVALTAPAKASSSPIAVQYTGDADVARVDLYFKKDGGAWQQSSESATGSSGTLNFNQITGDGVYYFDVIAFDDSDNPTEAPSGAGAASTTYDTTAPTGGSITVPEYVNTASVNIAFDGVTDNLSPIDTVTLWVKKGSGGAWQSSGVASTGGAGSFAFSGFTGDDTYFFAIVAEDEPGNASDEPTGDGLGSTVKDDTAPTRGTLTAPETTSEAPIEITYSGITEDGSGLKSVFLYVRKGPGGWNDSGIAPKTTDAGNFSYNGVTGDGTYYFSIVAEDNAGNRTTVPTGVGQDSTSVDMTDPEPATATSNEYASASPITINFTSTEPAETFERVIPWVRKGTGPWTPTGDTISVTSGPWAYTGASGDDTYHFHFQVEDKSGNTSPDPTGEGATSVIFDTIAPSTGSITVNGEYDIDNPINLAYSGVNDTTSGLKDIELWVMPPSGTWQPTGTTATGASGTLTYNTIAGDGEYKFAILAEDNAGNRSPNPAGEGLASITYDATPPSTGSLTGPESVDAGPIELSYSGVTDDGSGLDTVTLYVKKDGGSWAAANPAVTDTAESGTLSYSPSAGDGSYYFDLRTKDNAGNESALPTGSGKLTVVFDTSAPDTGTVTAPEFEGIAPIDVQFSGVSDEGSGIKTVSLFVKKDAGAWSDTGLSSSGSAGSFQYNPDQGDGTYYFALKAEDNVGVISPDPSGQGQASTQYDTVAPTGGSIDAPEETDALPISILYSGVSDTGTGVERVSLWFKKGPGGTWTDSGEFGSAASGSFSFSGVTDDDEYFFALRSEDKSGNESSAPTGDGLGSTTVDRSFTGGTATTEEYANSLPITVTFSGAAGPDGETIDVYLWVKQGADGAWAEAGLPPVSAESGEFLYEGATEEGEYFFAVQAEDSNGERTDEPFGEGDASTIYDITPPQPILLDSEEATNQSPITITYETEEDTGSGLKEVRIWVKPGIDGIWEQTTMIQAGTEGSFDYEEATEEKIYYFYLQTVDNADNESEIPTDEIVFAPPAP